MSADGGGGGGGGEGKSGGSGRFWECGRQERHQGTRPSEVGQFGIERNLEERGGRVESVLVYLKEASR